MTSRPPTASQWTVWLVRGPLLLILAVLIVRAGWEYLETRRLERLVDQMRRRGDPLSPQAPPPIPEPANAARLYSAAMELVVFGSRPRPLPQLVRMTNAGMGPDAREDVRRLLDENATAFELLDRAGQMPECQPPPLREGWPSFMNFRRLGNLASVRTRWRALAGDGPGTAAALQSSLGLLRVVDPPTSTLADLIKANIHGDNVRDVQFAIERRVLPSAALVPLAEAVLATSPDGDPLRAVQREQAHLLETFRDRPWELVPEARTSFLPPWLAPPVSSRARCHLENLGRLREIISGSGADRARALTSATRSRSEDCIDNSFWWAPVVYRSMTTVHAAAAALLVESYRQANGRLPERLAEVAPEASAALVDPFLEQSLQYRQTADGYVIYGLGPNLKDDGGQVEAALPSRLGATDWGLRIRIAPAPADGRPRPARAGDR